VRLLHTVTCGPIRRLSTALRVDEADGRLFPGRRDGGVLGSSTEDRRPPWEKKKSIPCPASMRRTAFLHAQDRELLVWASTGSRIFDARDAWKASGQDSPRPRLRLVGYDEARHRPLLVTGARREDDHLALAEIDPAPQRPTASQVATATNPRRGHRSVGDRIFINHTDKNLLDVWTKDPRRATQWEDRRGRTERPDRHGREGPPAVRGHPQARQAGGVNADTGATNPGLRCAYSVDRLWEP